MRILLIMVLMFFSTVKIADGEIYFEVEEHPIADPLPPDPIYLFMEKIAQIESGGSYEALNRFGFMGRYQFSPRTVKYLGYTVSEDQFLNNPQLQDSIMVAYMKYNDEFLDQYIEEFDGTTLNGIVLNRAAILAGAHFAGGTGMRRYLLSHGETTTVDSNGMEIRKYIESFSDINMPRIHYAQGEQ